MKTDHLITRLLKSELSDASKAKLGRLINIMNSGKEKAWLDPLIDSLRNDKTIQSVFDDAEVTMQINAQQQYTGYMDTTGVLFAFSISRRTLREWSKKGILQYHKFGGKNYFLRKDVENLFLKNYTGNSVTPSTKSMDKKLP